jgi:hypothetical protein
MAGYKVSYKILRQQGDDMKAVGKLVDGYAENVSQIRGKLGSDNMLAEVRNNLQKLQTQLGESRAVLNTAGEFLVQTVDSYSCVEVRQVKNVDGSKAHNRDFYKNPVTVASVGGAAAGVAAAIPVNEPAPANTVNYTDNSVNITRSAAEPAAADIAQALPDTEVAAGVAVAAAGVALGAGAAIGVKHLIDEKKKENQKAKGLEAEE